MEEGGGMEKQWVKGLMIDWNKKESKKRIRG